MRNCPEKKKSAPPLFIVGGFTLIEILVVIGVISIIFGLAVVRYQQFNRRQIVLQAAQELKNNLRLAQGKAIAGEKPENWCDGDGETLDGYRLAFTDRSTYGIEAICSDDSTMQILSVSLPVGVSGQTGTQVLFRVLALGVENGGTFFINGYNQQIVLIVSKTGEIQLVEDSGGIDSN